MSFWILYLSTNSWAAHSPHTEQMWSVSQTWTKRIDPIRWLRSFRVWRNVFSINTVRLEVFRSMTHCVCSRWIFSTRKFTFSCGFGSSFWPFYQPAHSSIRQWLSCCRQHEKQCSNADSVTSRKTKSENWSMKFRWVFPLYVRILLTNEILFHFVPDWRLFVAALARTKCQRECFLKHHSITLQGIEWIKRKWNAKRTWFAWDASILSAGKRKGIDDLISIHKTFQWINEGRTDQSEEQCVLR